MEDYPNDPRGPNALILGYTEDKRPLHAVCAFAPSGTLLIITVYDYNCLRTSASEMDG
ncbi:MAG: DUF4258 domain-containing protein [Moorellaceae bacterium]